MVPSNILRFICVSPVFMLMHLLPLRSQAQHISKLAKHILLDDSAIATGHIGISIYEPATGKYWYNHNADKNFIPASNTKLFSLYAGMKYLGDSLTGLRYQKIDNDHINIFPTGDPTFLHPDFKDQPVLTFLTGSKTQLYLAAGQQWKTTALGNGWAWNDYDSDYMAERSPFPLHGNLVHFEYSKIELNDRYAAITWNNDPAFFNTQIDSVYSFTFAQVLKKTTDTAQLRNFSITRPYGSAQFSLAPANAPFKKDDIPFITDGYKSTLTILKKDKGINIEPFPFIDHSLTPDIKNFQLYNIRSRPSDSLFKPMMYNSDNFFAEQTLLMASNEMLGYMDESSLIDSLLATDLKDIPSKPRWVDGSGLSRYNLFTPRSFIFLLDKLNTAFGMERLKRILPTGGTGTLTNYYTKDSGYIFAKTGTLSNNCALSGYLYTKKGKLLYFSVLVNNYRSGATPVRRAVERFLLGIREKY